MSSGKKKLITFFLVVLFLAIPVTVFVVLKEQETRSQAQPATTLAFDPTSASKNVGDTFTLTITIDTGSNAVSGAELHVKYDTSKLSATSIIIASNPFLPVVLVDGAVSGGFAFITLGSQPSQPKKGSGALATITFRATASTGGAPTLVQFTSDTKVAGVGEGSTDVLAGQPQAAEITIGVPTTPTPSSSPTPTPTGVLPTPTSGAGGGGGGGGGRGGNVGIGKTAPTAAPTLRAAVPTTQPTAGPIPVTADITPTTVLTISGVTLFLLGAIFLLAL